MCYFGILSADENGMEFNDMKTYSLILCSCCVMNGLSLNLIENDDNIFMLLHTGSE